MSRPGPMRRASSIAAGSVQRSWTALRRRVTGTCWLAPDFQRSPTAIWAGSLAGRGDGDVGEQGAQQPLAVLVAGGRGCPQGGQVGDGGGELAGAGQLGLGGALRGERRLGVGQAGEPGFPPGLQGAGDQPVLRLAGQEGPLGPVGVVAGPLDGQLGGADRPLPPGGDLPGGGQRQRDLRGLDRGQQRGGDGLLDGVGADRPAQRRGDVVGAGVGALIARVAGPGSGPASSGRRRRRTRSPGTARCPRAAGGPRRWSGWRPASPRWPGSPPR